jgi:hypothetical protein
MAGKIFGFGCGIRRLRALALWFMGNKAITKEARRAAREAAAAAQEELARRTRANVEDLAAFFSARERAEGVEQWLAERQQVLRAQAAQRRGEQRVQCGRALRSMRDRGESVREIARMARVAEKTARELIREADAAQADVALGPAQSDDAASAPSAPSEADAPAAEEATRAPTVDAIAREGLSAPLKV